MEWIVALDLITHNSGDKPTFSRSNSQSFIDVTVLLKVYVIEEYWIMSHVATIILSIMRSYLGMLNSLAMDAVIY